MPVPGLGCCRLLPPLSLCAFLRRRAAATETTPDGRSCSCSSISSSWSSPPSPSPTRCSSSFFVLFFFFRLSRPPRFTVPFGFTFGLGPSVLRTSTYTGLPGTKTRPSISACPPSPATAGPSVCWTAAPSRFVCRCCHHRLQHSMAAITAPPLATAIATAPSRARNGCTLGLADGTAVGLAEG